MTVGQALAELSGYKLFHNHMTIDLVTEIFEFGTPPFHRLVSKMRRMVVGEAARVGLPGLIFTLVWGLNLEEDHQFVDSLASLVERHGGHTWFVELYADLEVRLERNRSENRRRHKPKLPVDVMDERIRSNHPGLVLNSTPSSPFAYPERYIRVETGTQSPLEAARTILDRLDSLPVPPPWPVREA